MYILFILIYFHVYINNDEIVNKKIFIENVPKTNIDSKRISQFKRNNKDNKIY